MITGIIAGAIMAVMIPKMANVSNFIPTNEMVYAGSNYYIELEDSDIDLMARVVMSEAGGESDDCKEAVATVILNRMFSPKYPNTISEVIYQRGAFSTADNGEPTEACYLAIYSALTYYGSDSAIVPYCCYYFRGGHYHGFAQDYCKIDNLYFSIPKDACIN